MVSGEEVPRLVPVTDLLVTENGAGQLRALLGCLVKFRVVANPLTGIKVVGERRAPGGKVLASGDGVKAELVGYLGGLNLVVRVDA